MVKKIFITQTLNIKSNFHQMIIKRKNSLHCQANVGVNFKIFFFIIVELVFKIYN